MNQSAGDAAKAAWARIMPFLRPVEALIGDPDVSDIEINGERGVFFEKEGRMEQAAGIRVAEQSLQVAARNIARALGDEISEECPLLDSRLPDGSRVAIVLWPVSVGGTSVSIRKFQHKRYGPEELVRSGMIPREVLEELVAAIVNRRTILISGGTGTGKTTLLNALCVFIPDDERLIVIEDTSEIQIGKPNVVPLEARRGQADLPGISIGDLLRQALRMRPDRIILGEVRGAEGFDLLQALNTGHQGSLSTIHANSATQALTRLSTCVMMAGIDLPHRAVRANVADALDYLVHIERRAGRRFVAEVLRIRGYNSTGDTYELESVYDNRNHGGNEGGPKYEPRH